MSRFSYPDSDGHYLAWSLVTPGLSPGAYYTSYLAFWSVPPDLGSFAAVRFTAYCDTPIGGVLTAAISGKDGRGRRGTPLWRLPVRTWSEVRIPLDFLAATDVRPLPRAAALILSATTRRDLPQICIDNVVWERRSAPSRKIPIGPRLDPTASGALDRFWAVPNGKLVAWLATKAGIRIVVDPSIPTAWQASRFKRAAVPLRCYAHDLLVRLNSKCLTTELELAPIADGQEIRLVHWDRAREKFERWATDVLVESKARSSK